MPAAPDEIDLRDSNSVELWCAALGVSTAELVRVVALVGTSGEEVALYIRATKAASARSLM